eukprot:Skav212406  [mRNA]  locus=scaffold469:108808:121382:+ [translate_table: standard]
MVKGDNAHAILHWRVARLDAFALVKGLTRATNASAAVVGNADVEVFDRRLQDGLLGGDHFRVVVDLDLDLSKRNLFELCLHSRSLRVFQQRNFHLVRCFGRRHGQ